MSRMDLHTIISSAFRPNGCFPKGFNNFLEHLFCCIIYIDTVLLLRFHTAMCELAACYNLGIGLAHDSHYLFVVR